MSLTTLIDKIMGKQQEREKARAADFQNLRPNPECQTGGAQHGERQETASAGRPDVQRSCFRCGQNF